MATIGGAAYQGLGIARRLCKSGYRKPISSRLRRTNQLADTKAVASGANNAWLDVRMMSRTASWRANSICKRYPSLKH